MWKNITVVHSVDTKSNDISIIMVFIRKKKLMLLNQKNAPLPLHRLWYMLVGFKLIAHPVYWPGLAHALHHFPNLKQHLGGHGFTHHHKL